MKFLPITWKAGKAEHQCWWTESRFKNEIRHSQMGILDISRSRRFSFWLLVLCFSLFVVWSDHCRDQQQWIPELPFSGYIHGETFKVPLPAAPVRKP